MKRVWITRGETAGPVNRSVEQNGRFRILTVPFRDCGQPPIPGVCATFDDGGVDVVLNGHQHDYERFAPITPSGTVDSARGVREFVVGTGGYSVWGTGTALSSSRARGSAFGILKLTLHASSYDWRFVPIAGSTYSDSGTATCH